MKLHVVELTADLIMVKAIEKDMVQYAHLRLLGVAPVAASTLAARAQWFGCACLSRPEEQFGAPVFVTGTLALRAAQLIRAPLIVLMAAPVSFFSQWSCRRMLYLHPPTPGALPDGLPVPIATPTQP